MNWTDESTARRYQIVDAFNVLVCAKAEELAGCAKITTKEVDEAYYLVIAEQLSKLLKMTTPAPKPYVEVVKDVRPGVFTTEVYKHDC